MYFQIRKNPLIIKKKNEVLSKRLIINFYWHIHLWIFNFFFSECDFENIIDFV